MPIHDWTRVEAGIFHHFHQRWIAAISDAMNAGLLPKEYYALAEQHAAGFEPDVLALEETSGGDTEPDWSESPASGGTALLEAPPKLALQPKPTWNSIAVSRTPLPCATSAAIGSWRWSKSSHRATRDSQHSLQAFVEKAADLLDEEIHLLIVDLHPPGPRDPLGIHGAIWDDICDQRVRSPRRQAAHSCLL